MKLHGLLKIQLILLVVLYLPKHVATVKVNVTNEMRNITDILLPLVVKINYTENAIFLLFFLLW